MKNVRLIQKINRPIGNTLLGILLGQALLGTAVTYFEGRSILNVNKKLLEEEKKIMNA